MMGPACVAEAGIRRRLDSVSPDPRLTRYRALLFLLQPMHIRTSTSRLNIKWSHIVKKRHDGEDTKESLPGINCRRLRSSALVFGHLEIRSHLEGHSRRIILLTRSWLSM